MGGVLVVGVWGLVGGGDECAGRATVACQARSSRGSLFVGGRHRPGSRGRPGARSSQGSLFVGESVRNFMTFEQVQFPGLMELESSDSDQRAQHRDKKSQGNSLIDIQSGRPGAEATEEVRSAGVAPAGPQGPAGRSSSRGSPFVRGAAPAGRRGRPAAVAAEEVRSSGNAPAGQQWPAWRSSSRGSLLVGGKHRPGSRGQPGAVAAEEVHLSEGGV